MNVLDHTLIFSVENPLIILLAILTFSSKGRSSPFKLSLAALSMIALCICVKFSVPTRSSIALNSPIESLIFVGRYAFISDKSNPTFFANANQSLNTLALINSICFSSPGYFFDKVLIVLNPISSAFANAIVRLSRSFLFFLTSARIFIPGVANSARLWLLLFNLNSVLSYILNISGDISLIWVASGCAIHLALEIILLASSAVDLGAGISHSYALIHSSPAVFHSKYNNGKSLDIAVSFTNGYACLGVSLNFSLNSFFFLRSVFFRSLATSS